MTLSWLHRADAIAVCPPQPATSPGRAGRPTVTCRRWTLTVVCLASVLLMFNVTAPNVALPDIARTLGAGFDDLQWVLSAYAIVLAGLLLAGGALGDRYGHRRLFGAGLGIFAAGSLLCALAPAPGVLIAGRVVQGVGAAALFPAGLALIGAEFRGSARARAVGVWGASVAAAIALGPLAGGAMVAVGGWRAQFTVAFAVALPTIVVAARHLRESEVRTRRLDWAGTALLCAASFVAVLVLTRATVWGWTSVVTGLGVAVAVGLAVAFGVVEHRVRHPLVDPQLLHNRTFVAATAVALLFAGAAFAPLVYITQFLMTVAGSGPVLAGAQIAPFGAAAFAVSLAVAPLAARVGTRATLASGLALCGAGLGLLLLLGPPTSLGRLLPGLALFGVGAGLVNPTMTMAALSAVPVEQAGLSAGVNNAARQFGIAVGIAGFGAAVQATLAGGVRADLMALGVAEESAFLAGGQVGRGDLDGAAATAGVTPGVIGEIYRVGYGAALDVVLLLGIGVAAAGVVVVLTLIGSGRDARRDCLDTRSRGGA